MDLKKWYSENLTRRQALKTMGGLTGAGFMIGAGTYNIHQVLARKARLAATPTISPTATGTGDATSIQHVLIACQENRSFDTYFGMYPKAGSYGIQGLGAVFVKQISGDYYSVVGLPISRVVRELKTFRG